MRRWQTALIGRKLSTLAVVGAVVAVGLTGAAASPAGGERRTPRAAERFDVGLTVSVTRHRVPYGGTFRGVLKITNRGNVAVPTADEPDLVFGAELNRPGRPHAAGKAKYAYVRGSRAADCSHGTYGSTTLQTFACDTTHLAPGESQTVRFKVRAVKSGLLVDAGGFYGASGRVFDDNRRNDEDPTIIRLIPRR